MQTALYVGMAGQIALERRLNTVAHNVANATTAGFRAEGVHFESFLSRVPQLPVNFATTGGDYLVEESGGLAKTGNPLDVAVQGKGYIAIQTPAGIAYTRDGRLRLGVEGDLVTLNGHQVLDAGQAPISLDPSGGAIDIARDGMVSQGGRQVGAIGLFEIDASRPYRRFENAAVLPSAPTNPILSFDGQGFVQGFVEESNVNPLREMTHLIFVARAFESLAAAIDDQAGALRNAIQTLGAGR